MVVRFERVADSPQRVGDFDEDRSVSDISQVSRRQRSAAFSAGPALRIAIELCHLCGLRYMRSIGERLNVLRYLLGGVRSARNDTTRATQSVTRSEPWTIGYDIRWHRADYGSARTGGIDRSLR